MSGPELATPFEGPNVRRWASIAIVAGLLVGGVLVPVFGWFAAAYFFLRSTVWSSKQKLIGTFLLPGGWMAAAYLLFGGGGSVSCHGVHGVGAVQAAEACHRSGLVLGPWLGVPLLVAAFLLPLVSAVVLLRQVHEVGRPEQRATD